ncbi:MAG: S8 family serine peptidase [Myxococcales bacterium]|nr:S8 family serine peptidase [Myxococcales bacterium]
MPTRLVEPTLRASADASAWGVKAVGADVTPRTGAGVVVAVLDTGIDSAHPAFAGVDLVQRDFSGADNGDRNGHGTHCAGTIFGRDVEGKRIGIARGVTRALIGKVLADDGSGSSDALFRGIQWSFNEGAKVLSMSIGFDFPGMVASLTADGFPQELAFSIGLEAYRANLRMFDSLMALARARQLFDGGCVVIAASGNESDRARDPRFEIAASLPACADGVIAVGALALADGGLEVAPFSNTFPQIAAPGVRVLSAKAGGGLITMNGTSMATPHVAGVAALWWEEVRAVAAISNAQAVTAKLLANARVDMFAPGVDPADRGSGVVRAPI